MIFRSEIFAYGVKYFRLQKYIIIDIFLRNFFLFNFYEDTLHELTNAAKYCFVHESCDQECSSGQNVLQNTQPPAKTHNKTNITKLLVCHTVVVEYITMLCELYMGVFESLNPY